VYRQRAALAHVAQGCINPKRFHPPQHVAYYLLHKQDTLRPQLSSSLQADTCCSFLVGLLQSAATTCLAAQPNSAPGPAAAAAAASSPSCVSSTALGVTTSLTTQSKARLGQQCACCYVADA
jgi:hypothetical protein